MEKNNDTLNEDEIEKQTSEVEGQSELSNSEREELEKLRKEKEKEKPKSRNIYDRIDIKPETLTKVIVFGIVVIIGAIILGILAK